MEIMSFIKGSYEALSKPSGYLDKDEYLTLGMKRASNFSGEREVIYDLFLKYEHFKKKKQLFDETDFVHDIFGRLCRMKFQPWVIHQIFVDETQDFTQAELCLLVQLCRNPNEMFLTGDTAQSIMRGISFRFNDLQSLFFHAKHSMQAMGKTSNVEVPKQIYQLTQNYRSHSGIVSLATSVLDLMVEFFPESFDQLKPDQGLFHGPKPILFAFCSFSDLAVLLVGNEKKTSDIEFGAHQAIIVVNDNAKKNIPEELKLGLVLTIYEAKGLEFDDILLYNFFKDSQAKREWRIVTDFVNRLAAQEETAICHHESLVTIDGNILAEKNRPRPLEFDANEHKVLNSELKQLYTALTRARVKVWIFDEDSEKRAPMFEYFKARNLVECLHMDTIQKSTNEKFELVFAEKSSPAEWVNRGKEFASHSLYGVAAKCFAFGDDTNLQKIALAHDKAQHARHLKNDNPKLMRDEYLHAAALYMDCNRPNAAVKCLLNAKEKKIAAALLEKLGEIEKAAEIYRQIRESISSYRCYKQIGNFKKAVDVLYENENYVTAVECVQQYNALVRQIAEQACAVPQQLLDNIPNQYTKDHLWHKAAELFYRIKNYKNMLNAVNHFQIFDEQIQFLKTHDFLFEAAMILQEAGQQEIAAQFFLNCALYDKALHIARELWDESFIAHCLIVKCRIMMLKKDIHKDELLNSLTEAKHIYRTSSNYTGLGVVELLLAELSGDIGHVNNAWDAFRNVSPRENQVGLIECLDCYIQLNGIENNDILCRVVQSIEHMYSICKKLLQGQDAPNVQDIQTFYGFEDQGNETLEIFPKKQSPGMSSIITPMQRKRNCVTLSIRDAHKKIVYYLLDRSQTWVRKIIDALMKLIEENTICKTYQIGHNCPNLSIVEGRCKMLHTPQTIACFKKLLQLDMLWIEYESNIQCGIASLGNMRSNNFNISNDYLTKYRKYTEEHVKCNASCNHLWDDIMTVVGHAMFITETNYVTDTIRTNEKVLCYLRRWLYNRWHNAVECKNNKQFECQAVKETEIFLFFEFGYHLFGCDMDPQMFHSPFQEMVLLEQALSIELMRGNETNFEQDHVSTSCIYDDENRSVLCIARWFMLSYEHLLCDPLNAVNTFGKFMYHLDSASNKIFYSSLKQYIMWLEFYTTISILLIAKIKSDISPTFQFILTNNLLALVEFIDSTFHRNRFAIQNSIVCNAQNDELTQFLQTFKKMVDGVSGHNQNFKILNKVIHNSKKDKSNYVLLERLMILNMVLLINYGTVLPAECESGILMALRDTHMPADAPKALKNIGSALKEAKLISHVANVLKEHFSARQLEEKLLVCKWQGDNENKIESQELVLSIFAGTLLEPTTEIKERLDCEQIVDHVLETKLSK